MEKQFRVVLQTETAEKAEDVFHKVMAQKEIMELCAEAWVETLTEVTGKEGIEEG